MRSQAAQNEVASLTGRLGLLEEEYWATKSKLLDAELTRGEIEQARDRAEAYAAVRVAQ